jgi:hypothetical protein
MLRIFFPQYKTGSATWETYFTLDATFPWFQWGTSATYGGKTYRPIKRCRVNTPTAYDEYVDIHTAAIDVEPAPVDSMFTNSLGLSTRVLQVTDSMLADSLVNRLDIDSDAAEWLSARTHSITYPHPDLTKAVTSVLRGQGGTIELINETVEAGASITGYRLFAFAFAGASARGPFQQPIVVPYNTESTDNFTVLVHNPFTDLTHIHIAKANVSRVLFDRHAGAFPDMVGWQWDTQPRILAQSLAAGGAATYNYTGQHLLKTADFDYASGTGVEYLADFAFEDDPVSRMALAWSKRNRYAAADQFLIIDPVLSKYWKGFFIEASPLFLVGADKTEDKSAKVSILVTEEGYCLTDALYNPNTTANFSALDRTVSP